MRLTSAITRGRDSCASKNRDRRVHWSVRGRSAVARMRLPPTPPCCHHETRLLDRSRSGHDPYPQPTRTVRRGGKHRDLDLVAGMATISGACHRGVPSSASLGNNALLAPDPRTTPRVRRSTATSSVSFIAVANIRGFRVPLTRNRLGCHMGYAERHKAVEGGVAAVQVPTPPTVRRR